MHQKREGDREIGRQSNRNRERERKREEQRQRDREITQYEILKNSKIRKNNHEERYIINQTYIQVK